MHAKYTVPAHSILESMYIPQGVCIYLNLPVKRKVSSKFLDL